MLKVPRSVFKVESLEFKVESSEFNVSGSTAPSCLLSGPLCPPSMSVSESPFRFAPSRLCEHSHCER